MRKNQEREGGERGEYSFLEGGEKRGVKKGCVHPIA
jgi:hypothetical protein